MSGRPRLIVFDWDGTLIDSIGAIVDCSYAMFAELGLDEIPRDRVLSLIGMGLSDSIDALAPGAGEEAKGRVIETYRRLWFGQYHHRTALMDGAEGVVAALAEEGYLLAVATAKSRRGLAADFERTGLGVHFHSSRTADESAAKPSPAMLLDLLDELGVRAEEALMIGDSVHDLHMAHNARVPVVGVASGAQSRESLLGQEPLDCLDSVRELPTWLAGERFGVE